jgi:ABC-type phosphate transport system substrate-binding protein
MTKKVLWLLLLATALLCTVRSGAQTVVIANSSVKSADIPKGDLRDIFTGASTSLKDGSHVVPVLLKSGTVHDEFLASYIGKGDTPFRAGWRSLVFSGQASMPKSFDTEAAVVEYVAHNAGAIGYISKATPHEGVKVFPVR